MTLQGAVCFARVHLLLLSCKGDVSRPDLSTLVVNLQWRLTTRLTLTEHF